MLHCDGGCLNCGEKRELSKICSGENDIYLLVPAADNDNWVGTKHINIGLCPTCYASRNLLDLNRLAEQLYVSESEASKRVVGDDSRAHEFKGLVDKISGIQDRVLL